MMAAHGAPRGAPCADCGKPIRTAPKPKGHNRKYCDRVRCRRARVNRRTVAFYRALGAVGPARQRARYDPEKRRDRYGLLTDAQRAAWLATGRRYHRAHREEINARGRANYDPAKRRARYLATGG